MTDFLVQRDKHVADDGHGGHEVCAGVVVVELTDKSHDVSQTSSTKKEAREVHWLGLPEAIQYTISFITFWTGIQ